MPLINKHKPIPRPTHIHIHHRLVRLPHPPSLNPRLHPPLHRHLQHLLDLPRRSNRRPADLGALGDQAEGAEGGHFVLGRADLDEGAVGGEEKEVGF